MTVKNILIGVLELLGKETETGEDGSLTDEALLVRCLNMIIKELAEEYVEFRITEDVDYGGDLIPYSVFSREVRCVKCIKKDGRYIDFKESKHGVEVDADGVLKVTYCYNYPEVSAGDGLDLPRRITERVLTYGTAAEYCLMKELYEESANFNSRYARALASINRPVREVRVKERRWI